MSWGQVWAHRAKTTQPMHPNSVPKLSWDQIRKSQSQTNPPGLYGLSDLSPMTFTIYVFFLFFLGMKLPLKT